MKPLILLTLLTSLSVNADVGMDKYMHFGMSALIGGVVQNGTENIYISTGVCMGAGLAKEAYDQYSYGGFSKDDLIADAIGCAIGTGGVSGMKPSEC